MINKKIGLGLVLLSSFGLIACGTDQTGSSNDDDQYVQESSTFEETIYKLAITGSGDFTQGHNWAPADIKDIAELNFVRVDKFEYKLENITFKAGDQFKFVFDYGWTNAIGFDGLDKKSSAYADFEDAGGNCKAKVDGTYDFFYHPFWVAETDKYAGNMAVRLHTDA